MTWHAVGKAEQLAEGRSLMVAVEGKEIGIFRENGAYFAVLNVCPHAFAPIAATGRVEGTLTANTSGSYQLDQGRKVLRCPWHHWEFELDGGRPVCHLKQRLKTFPVEVESGVIKVNV